MIWTYLVAAYLIGSFPTALIVGKLFFGVDVRNHGSNNPGATNTLRVLGKRAAIFVLLFDVAKGAVAALLPTLFNLDIDPIVIGMLAVVGHCFPIFAGFRGGKAIATTAGVLLVANFWMFLAAYGAFFLMIYLTKYVFVGSISVGVALLIYSFFAGNPDLKYLFLTFVLFLFYLHRTNIQRFMNHNEPKINDKSLKNDRITPRRKES